MKLIVYGAAHEVTGSLFLLEAAGKNILIDCGMEQGIDSYENQELRVNPCDVDCVLLTHAHIDHSGNLPLLYKNGFSGEIHTTSATHSLCEIMLRDTAHIQQVEAEWKNRKAKRASGEAQEPLYSMEDAEGALTLFKDHEYDEIIPLFDGVRARFVNAGHILGAASIEVWIKEAGETRKIVFSGDIGNKNQPLIYDPAYIDEADYVVMESTYGDKSHGPHPDYIHDLATIIQDTFDKGGNLVIPSFAVGRTQEVLYYIRQIKEQKLVKGHGNFVVYVDSPMAIEATNIYNENMYAYFDEEALSLVKQGINPISFPGLQLSLTSEESKAINFDNESKVIISASGMCEAGRIRHHLKHNLWREDSTILFVGYQGVGTLGRMILDGAKTVKLFGDQISVKATIAKLQGISAHADKEGLLEWVLHISPKPKTVFVVHGDELVCESFAKELQDNHGIHALCPYSGAQYDLLSGVMLEEGNMQKIERKEKRAATVFDRLLAAGNKLFAVINRNKGGANKDLAKFADQIESLAEKWDR